MKRFASLILAVLLVVAMATGCGGRSETDWTTPEDSYEDEYLDDNGGKPDEPANEPETNEPEFADDSEVAEYPGELFNGKPFYWVQESSDGYMIEQYMELYQPVLSTQAFKLQDLPVKEYGENSWIIPFKYSLKNVTEGFGHAIIECHFGVGLYVPAAVGALPKEEAFSGPLRMLPIFRAKTSLNLRTVAYDNYYDEYIDDEDLEDYGGSFMLIIEEGDTFEIYGYFVLTEPNRTPNKPIGYDQSDFEPTQEQGVLPGCIFIYAGMPIRFAGMNPMPFNGAAAGFCRITKDEAGNLILTRQWE